MHFFKCKIKGPETKKTDIVIPYFAKMQTFRRLDYQSSNCFKTLDIMLLLLFMIKYVFL